MDTTESKLIVKLDTLRRVSRGISGGAGQIAAWVVLAGIASTGLSACSSAGGASAPVPADVEVTNVPATTDGANSPGLLVADSASSSLNALSDSPFGNIQPRLSLREESDLVFNILTAEIAGRLGLVDVASEKYFDASIATQDPRVSERAVKLAIYGQNLQRAALASSRWVELVPDNIEAWQHRAQVLIQLEEVDMAIAAIEQMLELTGEEPGAVIPSLVDSILQQSSAGVGKQLLEELAARYPDNAETQFGIGQFAMSAGERELAGQAFERALAIDPDNIETILARARLQLNTGEGDRALDAVTEYLSRSPDDLSAQLGYARLLIESGKVERAADQLEVIQTTFPEDAVALYTIGLLALDIQRIGSAEKYLTSVAALDQHQDSANFYLGRISDSRSDYHEAIGRYLEVQGGEHYLSAQIRAAELLGLVGEVDEGRSLLAKLRSTVDDPSVSVQLINAESLLLNSDNLYEESLQLLTDGIEQYNEDPALLYTRALVAEKLDRRELFEADLKKVIELQPDNSHALNALGYFLVNRYERLTEAEEYLVRAHNISPEDAAITDSLGWLFYKLGRYADSLVLLKKAYAELPDPEIAAHLGEVLWVSGDQAEALKVWEGALRDAPDHDLLNNVMKKYNR